MARHDPGGSGLTTGPSPITAASVSRLQPLWHGGTTKFSYAQPIVDSGHVIVTTSDGLIQALDSATGALQWQHSFADIGSTDPPVVQSGRVFVGMLTQKQTGLVAALRESDGTLAWQHAISPDAAATYPVGDITLTVGGGRIYVGADARLIALSPASGRQLWRTNGCTPDGYTCSFGAGFLAYGDERIVASGDVYSQVIFDAKTGKLLHRIATDNYPHAPAVVGKQAYVETGTNNDLTGLADITPLNCTGSPCKPARRITLGVGATNWPTISHGMIFSPTTANPQMSISPSLVVTDLATGKRKWDADIQGAQVFATTAVNDLVFASVPGTRQILAYRAAGCGTAVCSPIWSITVPGDPYDYLWPPAIVGDTIYIESAWNGVFAYRLAAQ
jgi:outer membrane protein assembly factor BamB